MENIKDIINIENINSNLNLYNMSCQDGLFTKKKDELKQIVKNFNDTIPISKLNKAQLLCLIIELSKKAQPKPSQKVEPKPQPKPSQKVEPKPQPKPSQKVEPKPQPKPSQKVEPKQDELNVNDFKKTELLRSAIYTYNPNRKTNIVGISKMGGEALRKIVIDKKMDLIKLADNYIRQININLDSYKNDPSLSKKIKKELDEFISRVGSKGMKQIEEMRKAEKEEYKKMFEAQMAKMTPQQKKKRDELIKADEEAKQQAFIQKRFDEYQKSRQNYKYSSDLRDMVKRFVRNEYKINDGAKVHKQMEEEFKQGLLNFPEGEAKEEMKDFIAFNLDEMYSENGSHISKSLYNFIKDFAKEYIEED